MKLKKERTFKILIFAIIVFLVSMPGATTITALALENDLQTEKEITTYSTTDEETLMEDNELIINQEGNLLEPSMKLFSNQTDGGGSKYKLVSKQTVNMKTTNTLYHWAFLAIGFNAVTKVAKKAIAGTVVTIAGDYGINYKGYKYLRQTIYKYSTKTQDKYKIIDEYSNSKTTWKGPVTTSYSTVKK
ncbi:hypothetical protein [Listeria seeligeri]|uniref:hypothetical protein n=1 Tax=Listeria seeligeri TaxID=1640 RepID=UPI00162AD88D|nr:hypothetical protein [Listeria seeligeri]MBC2246395.1 hypothetical protein [Listeria seeligeri]MBF2400848.1 hypothetical protein [Listeria seeligeri]MBF2663902.1 hypothetical protein [Listeria seeligeri]